MLYKCALCNTPFVDIETALECEDSHQPPTPSPRPEPTGPRHGMRYEVQCSMIDCYLYRNPIAYPEARTAEDLASVHESRFRDAFPDSHLCDVKDLNEVPASLEPKTATGAKEAGNG